MLFNYRSMWNWITCCIRFVLICSIDTLCFWTSSFTIKYLNFICLAPLEYLLFLQKNAVKCKNAKQLCDELGRNNFIPTKDGKGQIVDSVQSKRISHRKPFTQNKIFLKKWNRHLPVTYPQPLLFKFQNSKANEIELRKQAHKKESRLSHERDQCQFQCEAIQKRGLNLVQDRYKWLWQDEWGIKTKPKAKKKRMKPIRHWGGGYMHNIGKLIRIHKQVSGSKKRKI